MSKYEQKDLEGVLFANKEKVKETDCNAKGSAVIDGVEYWVNAWTNTSKAGEKYQKLSFTRKQQQAPVVQQGLAEGLGDDSIPF